MKEGELEHSTRLLVARLGTVDAICGWLVAEFALDLSWPRRTGLAFGRDLKRTHYGRS